MGECLRYAKGWIGERYMQVCIKEWVRVCMEGCLRDVKRGRGVCQPTFFLSFLVEFGLHFSH